MTLSRIDLAALPEHRPAAYTQFVRRAVGIASDDLPGIRAIGGRGGGFDDGSWGVPREHWG